MRKFASLFLLLFLIFSLAACSQSENSDTDSEQPPTSNSLEATNMQLSENFVLIKGGTFQMGSPDVYKRQFHITLTPHILWTL